MLNQPFIKELLTALFYFFVIFNIIIRIIVTKKRKKKKKKSRKGGGNIYEIFRDFLKIIWCIITWGKAEGCFQDKEVESVEQQLRRQERGDDFGTILNELGI
tara:strand:+ start:5450 stop:5755 length:306 start_codon:yes stop_codon:yes gene_type:complete